MARLAVATSISDYLAKLAEPQKRLGLQGGVATPWYLGQPDLKGSVLPALYRPETKIKAEYERDMLRDFKSSAVEFVSLRNYSDSEILVTAQINQLPTRIIEWTSNPLFALYLALENLNAVDNARVWILNPWRLNAVTSNIKFIPSPDHRSFQKYTVCLDLEDDDTEPEATYPMAFRPPRGTRNYNLQSVFWTIHGSDKTPIEDLKFLFVRTDDFLSSIEIARDCKRTMLKGLHDLGVTRAQFWPSLTSLTRTLAYRYSSNYIDEK